MQYEITYLVGEKNENKLDSIKKDIEEMIKKEKAEILNVELINQRKLSYEINHEIRGTYVTKRFELSKEEELADEYDYEREDPVSTISKKLNLYNDILRFIIVRADELPNLSNQEKEETAKIENVKKQETPKKEKKDDKQENIDEKLEEILNI